MSSSASGTVDDGGVLVAIEGTVRVRIEDQLQPGAPLAVSATRQIVEVDLSGSGERFTQRTDVTATTTSPMPWFPDREDLPTLPVGFTETSTTDLTVEGSAVVTLNGERESSSVATKLPGLA